MYIIISNSSRIPPDLLNFQFEQWSADEFIKRASDDDGIEVDEGLWYDVSALTEQIYEGLIAYSDAGVNLVYYKFDDTPELSFKIGYEVIVYQTNTKASTNTDLSDEEDDYEEETQPQIIVEVPDIIKETTTVTSTPVTVIKDKPVVSVDIAQGVKLVNVKPKTTINSPLNPNISNMLQYDDFESNGLAGFASGEGPGKVILFGSSKGGTGKTFTCLISAYWYAKTHPLEKVALADFDIIDGQIGITINKFTPTMKDFYTQSKGGNSEFEFLSNCKVKSEHFSPNIDFYLAPPQDIPEITNDNEFWTNTFKLLITNYDVVFFDSGIDYLGKQPISQLYKIADKINIVSNTSISSVKSVIKQFQTISGHRRNGVFAPEDEILNRVNVVLTRVYEDQADINDSVTENITKFAPIIAAFGNIDEIISQVQWFQHWELIDHEPAIIESLEDISRI